MPSLPLLKRRLKNLIFFNFYDIIYIKNKGDKVLKFVTSYFYKVRFFTPNMIPLSTAIWDP